MNIKPLADRVLVEVSVSEEKTSSGLFIPQTAQEKMQIAKVVAVGTDKDAINVKVGDKVMYDKYSGTTVKDGSKEYLILSISDILAIVE